MKIQRRPRYKDIEITTEGQFSSSGTAGFSWSDLYHALLTVRWIWFFLGFVATFWMLNAVFGTLYYVSNGIGGASSVTFLDCLFFSVQTLSTVGYGHLHPVNLTANILVAIEILLGLFLISTLTGLIFARFSRPKARILFSTVAVVHERDGLPTLSFRLANARNTHVAEAHIKVFLLRDFVTSEGHRMRRFLDLKLVRDETPALLLSWTVMHVIDPGSPLYGLSAGEFMEGNMSLQITMNGYDPVLAQTVQMNHAYLPGQIIWNAVFEDSIERIAGNRTRLHYDRLSAYRRII
ncbi:MAG: ion channel [Turneriella sp.]